MSDAARIDELLRANNALVERINMHEQRALTLEELAKVARTMAGTSMSLGEAVRRASGGRIDEDDLLIGDKDAIDALVFECQSCGHWFTQAERAMPWDGGDEWQCSDCADYCGLHTLADDGNPHCIDEVPSLHEVMIAHFLKRKSEAWTPLKLALASNYRGYNEIMHEERVVARREANCDHRFYETTPPYETATCTNCGHVRWMVHS
jgi:hypothetical protein